MSSWLELFIALFIVVGIVIAILKSGQANPVSTGRLGARLGRVEKEVGSVQTEVRSISNRVDQLERQIAELPTKADIDHLKDLMARDAAASERTWAAVERIEGFFIEQGVKRK